MPLLDSTPWLNKTWQQIQTARQRLPHALLVSGLTGLGKFDFANQLAASLLCANPDNEGTPCGHCKSCHLFNTGGHPDFRLIQPEEKSNFIVVDQIRELIGFMALRPHTAAQKVVLVAPAEAMNINAANSLLKLLEEPPADSILILVSSAPRKLSATVRSRCMQLAIQPPSLSEGQKWLEAEGLDAETAIDALSASGGAPLQALALVEQGFGQARSLMIEDLKVLRQRTGDPVTIANKWKTIGAAFCLEWMSGFLADLIQLSLMNLQSARLCNPSAQSDLLELARDTAPQHLFELQDKVIEAANLAATPLDDTLLIEDILIRWCKTCSKKAF